MVYKHFKKFYLTLPSIVLLLCAASAVKAEFTLTPRITTGISYTDNVFLDDEEVEDSVFTMVSPGFDAALSGRKAALEISYNPTYTAINPYPEYNLWGHEGSLNAWVEIARGARIELNESYSKSSDPVSETDTTVRHGRSPHAANSAKLALINEFGPEDKFELRYEHQSLENDDPTVEDSARHNPGALFTWWFSPARYAIEIEGSGTISDFDRRENFEALDARMRLTKRFGRHVDAYLEYSHSATDFLEDGMDYHVYNPTAGIIWKMDADTEFSVGFGYFYRDEENGDSDDGIAGSVEMRRDWTERGSLTLKGDMGYDRAYFGAENLGFNPYSEVSGSITQQLGRRITGSVTAGFRNTKYIDEEPDREDTRTRAGGSLTFQALPWMVFQIDYEYRRLDSSVDRNDYEENRGTFTISLTARKPLRL